MTLVPANMGATLPADAPSSLPSFPSNMDIIGLVTGVPVDVSTSLPSFPSNMDIIGAYASLPSLPSGAIVDWSLIFLYIVYCCVSWTRPSPLDRAQVVSPSYLKRTALRVIFDCQQAVAFYSLVTFEIIVNNFVAKLLLALPPSLITLSSWTLGLTKHLFTFLSVLVHGAASLVGLDGCNLLPLLVSFFALGYIIRLPSRFSVTVPRVVSRKLAKLERRKKLVELKRRERSLTFRRRLREIEDYSERQCKITSHLYRLHKTITSNIRRRRVSLRPLSARRSLTGPYSKDYSQRPPPASPFARQASSLHQFATAAIGVMKIDEPCGFTWLSHPWYCSFVALLQLLKSSSEVGLALLPSSSCGAAERALVADSTCAKFVCDSLEVMSCDWEHAKSGVRACCNAPKGIWFYFVDVLAFSYAVSRSPPSTCLTNRQRREWRSFIYEKGPACATMVPLPWMSRQIWAAAALKILTAVPRTWSSQAANTILICCGDVEENPGWQVARGFGGLVMMSVKICLGLCVLHTGICVVSDPASASLLVLGAAKTIVVSAPVASASVVATAVKYFFYTSSAFAVYVLMTGPSTPEGMVLIDRYTSLPCLPAAVAPTVRTLRLNPATAANVPLVIRPEPEIDGLPPVMRTDCFNEPIEARNSSMFWKLRERHTQLDLHLNPVDPPYNPFKFIFGMEPDPQLAPRIAYGPLPCYVEEFAYEVCNVTACPDISCNSCTENKCVSRPCPLAQCNVSQCECRVDCDGKEFVEDLNEVFREHQMCDACEHHSTFDVCNASLHDFEQVPPPRPPNNNTNESAQQRIRRNRRLRRRLYQRARRAGGGGGGDGPGNGDDKDDADKDKKSIFHWLWLAWLFIWNAIRWLFSLLWTVGVWLANFATAIYDNVPPVKSFVDDYAAPACRAGFDKLRRSFGDETTNMMIDILWLLPAVFSTIAFIIKFFGDFLWIAGSFIYDHFNYLTNRTIVTDPNYVGSKDSVSVENMPLLVKWFSWTKAALSSSWQSSCDQGEAVGGAAKTAATASAAAARYVAGPIGRLGIAAATKSAELASNGYHALKEKKNGSYVMDVYVTDLKEYLEYCHNEFHEEITPSMLSAARLYMCDSQRPWNNTSRFGGKAEIPVNPLFVHGYPLDFSLVLPRDAGKFNTSDAHSVKVYLKTGNHRSREVSFFIEDFIFFKFNGLPIPGVFSQEALARMMKKVKAYNGPDLCLPTDEEHRVNRKKHSAAPYKMERISQTVQRKRDAAAPVNNAAAATATDGAVTAPPPDNNRSSSASTASNNSPSVDQSSSQQQSSSSAPANGNQESSPSQPRSSSAQRRSSSAQRRSSSSAEQQQPQRQQSSSRQGAIDRDRQAGVRSQTPGPDRDTDDEQNQGQGIGTPYGLCWIHAPVELLEHCLRWALDHDLFPDKSRIHPEVASFWANPNVSLEVRARRATELLKLPYNPLHSHDAHAIMKKLLREIVPCYRCDADDAYYHHVGGIMVHFDKHAKLSDLSVVGALVFKRNDGIGHWYPLLRAKDGSFYGTDETDLVTDTPSTRAYCYTVSSKYIPEMSCETRSCDFQWNNDHADTYAVAHALYHVGNSILGKFPQAHVDMAELAGRFQTTMESIRKFFY